MLLKGRTEDIVAAQAQVERAKAALKAAEASEAQSLDTAEARYQASLQDYQAALEQIKLLKTARQEDLKAAEAQVRRGTAALKTAQARLKEKQTFAEEVRIAQAQVQRLQEQLANFQTQLRDTVITAPISGVVIKKSVEVGELVASAISGFAQGTELITIADLSRLVVRVRLNEVDVSQIWLGQPAEVLVDAVPEKVFEGTVSKIAPAALDRLLTRQQTGTTQIQTEAEVAWFDVEVRLHNTDTRMKIGMSASVDIVAKRIKNALTVPLDALLEEDGSFYALVVTDQNIAEQVHKPVLAGRLDELRIPEAKVQTRKMKVRLGVRGEAKTQVTAGLSEGDVVLVKPPKRRGFEIRTKGDREEEGEE